MKYTRRTAVAALCLAVMLCAAARGQVLDQVPADALVVIKVRNLEEASKKFSKWAEALGLAQASPELADPLGALQEKLHIEKGLNKSGDLAIVMLDPKTSPGDSMLLLVPTSDYKAFVANIKDAKTVGEITQFTPPQPQHGPLPGKDMFVTNWGKYAVFSASKTNFAKKPAGLKLQGLAAREASEKDAIVYANIPAVRAKLLPEIAKARANFDAAMQRDLPKGDAGAQARKFAPVLSAVVGQLLNLSENFLKDANAATLSLNLVDEGLAVTMLADFKDGSSLGNVAKGIKNTNKPLLAGLPDRKYFAAGGIDTGGKALSQFLSAQLDPILAELSKVQPDGKVYADALSSMKDLWSAIDSMSAGYVVPTGPLGKDSVVQTVMVAHGDAKTIASAQKKVLIGMSQLFGAMPKQGGPQMAVKLEEGAPTKEGIKIDRYTIDMTFDAANDPSAAQAQQMMSMIYGPNGMSGRMAVLDDKTFVLAQGGNDGLITELLTSAKAQQDPLAKLEGVQSVSKQLPQQRFLVEYIALDNIITSALTYARGFGMQVPVQLPPNLPPIGAAMATDGSAVRLEAFVPTTLVQGVVAASMQAYMRMQGGHQGAGAPDGL